MWDTAELILEEEGGVRPYLTGLRQEGASYRDIADELRKHNIVVTYETVRAWFRRIENEASEAAS